MDMFLLYAIIFYFTRIAAAIQYTWHNHYVKLTSSITVIRVADEKSVNSKLFSIIHNNILYELRMYVNMTRIVIVVECNSWRNLILYNSKFVTSYRLNFFYKSENITVSIQLRNIYNTKTDILLIYNQIFTIIACVLVPPFHKKNELKLN